MRRASWRGATSWVRWRSGWAGCSSGPSPGGRRACILRACRARRRARTAGGGAHRARRPAAGRRAGRFPEGLLGAARRKNGWQLAEQIGDARPWRTQRVLSHVLWDEDAARDLCRDYVLEHLGAPDGVLIVDETGFLKKGEHSAGVARQYSGTAGRIENAQIGVFLAYASGKGHALIDRELYLPKREWCEDAGKRAEAAIPEAVDFATKPALASRMAGRALDAGPPAASGAGGG